MDETPVFLTEGRLLRGLQAHDSSALLRHYRDAECSEFMLFGPFGDESSAAGTIFWADQLVRQRKGILWGVFGKPTGELMGILDYVHRDYHDGCPYRSEINYDLSPEHWRRGIMVEAIVPTIQFMFSELQVRRIEASIDVSNYRSIRVVQKLGSSFEGILREYRCRQGKYYDAAMFSLLRCQRQRQHEQE